ncbi:hypothetical protein H4R22_005035, partial [Coemansia sp. RSA 1290]
LGLTCRPMLISALSTSPRLARVPSMASLACTLALEPAATSFGQRTRETPLSCISPITKP